MSQSQTTLPLPRDFDFPWTMGFLALRTVPSLERVAADSYQRVVWLDGTRARRPVLLCIEREAVVRGQPGSARLRIRATPAMPRAKLAPAVITMFDLDVDLARFRAQNRRDPVLGPLLRSNPRGLRLPQLLDPFEGLVRAILGQQVSVAAASTMTDRLVRLLPTPAPSLEGSPFSAAPGFAFPPAESVAEAGRSRLASIGLTRAKAATLHSAAMAVASGHLSLSRLRTLPAEEVDAALCELPGIGPWTAAYLRMRALGDRDAFPATDLGVLKALAARGVTPAGVVKLAERWRPWRAYATLHLWHSLAERALVRRGNRPLSLLPPRRHGRPRPARS